jgi:CRISPR system Cascade subunit CasD
MPIKSAIAGMCCAASGYSRGTEEETIFLNEFSKIQMTVIAIPRILFDNSKPLAVQRLQDCHTVMNTIKADGGIKECHITYRQYLCDALFACVLSGKYEMVEKIANSLIDPIWGLWLGRKACIPTAPVFAGLFLSREDAIKVFIGDEPIEKFTRQEDAESFSDGCDSLPDTAISFATDKRCFSPRRIKKYFQNNEHFIE